MGRKASSIAWRKKPIHFIHFVCRFLGARMSETAGVSSLSAAWGWRGGIPCSKQHPPPPQNLRMCTTFSPPVRCPKVEFSQSQGKERHPLHREIQEHRQQGAVNHKGTRLSPPPQGFGSNQGRKTTLQVYVARTNVQYFSANLQDFNCGLM